MTALHDGRIDQLETYPNLWAGVGLVRGGAGTALVGSHEEVAKLIYEYHSVGFDEFIGVGLPASRGGVLVRRRRVAAAPPERGGLKPVQQLYFSPMSAGGVTFCKQPYGTMPSSLNRAADWCA